MFTTALILLACLVIYSVADGFHLMKQIQILCIGVMAGLLVYLDSPVKAWWVFWGSWLLAQAILSVVFHYFFHTVFAAKNKAINAKSPVSGIS